MAKYNNASGYHHLYDKAQWKRLRLEVLQINPLCAYCLQVGQTTEATIADHIKPHKGDERLFYDASNLQALCKKCHDSIKQGKERHGIAKGADVNGLPIDREHHWYA